MLVEGTTDSIEFVKSLRSRDEWLRTEGKDLGVDGGKFILGSVLRFIVQDDGNCFLWSNLPIYRNNEQLLKQGIKDSQNEYLVRLHREVNTPELPPEIGNSLQNTLEGLHASDWTKGENFKIAEGEWKRLCGWVTDLIEDTPNLKEAFDYASLAMEARAMGLYQEFSGKFSLSGTEN